MKLRLLLCLSAILLSSCASHWNYVSPCLTNPQGDYKDLVTIIGEAQCYSSDALINEPITDEIKTLPAASQRPVVAIYRFMDLTGQRKSIDNFASFSTAVTQAPEAYLIRALKQSRFFRVVERVGLDHITKERQIIRSTRKEFEEDSDLSPLLFAGVILEGGIIDYNTNLKSGGIGARYLGIGNSKQYREDTVVISLRLVSVSTGEVLLEILSSKSILSVGLSNDFFRFIADGTKLVEFESGNVMNESVSIAVQAAIETAVVQLVKQGEEKGYWSYWEM
tara:strand:- start:2701 stop:3537 length:837 start_codon:yes stop_codon:yes gene_type:complete